MKRMQRLAAGVLLALPLAACADLEVTNPNDPDLHRAFSGGAEVEAHIAGAFREWYGVETGYQASSRMLSGVAFQHSTWAICDAPYAEIPRQAIENTQGSQCILSYRTWDRLYRALVRVADGLTVLEDRSEFRSELGAERMARLEAFARFVQGLAHGSLALFFQQGAVVDETVDRSGTSELPLLVEYGALMDAALDYLYEAAELSEGASWPAVPAGWMSVEVAPDRLAALARSFAARYRANAARTPDERAAVDWTAVASDAEAGITSDWTLDAEGDWIATTLSIVHRIERPTQVSYFIAGMADQSGSYQRWLSRPLFQRVPNPVSDEDGQVDPILIVTPDTRFPRGETLQEQMDSAGTLFVVPSEETIGRDPDAMWGQPARGTWRWSYYRYTGAQDYVDEADARWPAFTVAELRLLRAEALIRSGDPGGAAALVNESRTAHGLGPTDAAGTNADCVPRLPDGTCGDLMEMLKWEKRLETLWSGPFLASWYFDGRGWGDLYAGTFLQAPVPCSELEVLQMECYSFGGPGGESTAPESGYTWPDEGPGG